MEEIIRALELKKQLDSLRPLEKEQEARIMQKFRLDWNYHSNNLEGNSLTYGETKALIMHGITAQGKPLKDHFEITGHNEAINWILDIVKGSDYPLTENFIRELHTLLLKESYEVDAQTPDGKPTKKRVKVGSYKTSPNHVQTKTGEMFYFATPEETPAKMGDLIAWYNEKIADTDFNSILLAAEFHYKFILIHPFDDGNGRTARILMNFILLKFGYPPVIIKTEDKENYYAVLRLADTGNLEAFVEYIAKNLNRSLEIMIAGANGEDIEEPDDIDKEIALLEKRLAGYGKEINKEKSLETTKDIYVNTVYPLAMMLKNKFVPFEKFYLDTYAFIQVNGQQFNWPTFPDSSDSIIREIRIGIIFRQLKKAGLENYSFNYDLNIDFESLSYIIYAERNKPIFMKNYENLNDKEIKFLVDTAIMKYKSEVEEFLNK
ncbi:Fic family protein [Flavobacterium sp. DGU11]|uniref:Fic family protein n=1 Tax=Flavobacterium arundinis TaxID=3139143 RepID=A0ABU9HZ10_9FLAO